MHIKPIFQLLISSLAGFSFSVSAAVIDFETLEHEGAGVNNIDSPYIEAGYIIQDPDASGTINNAFAVYGMANPGFSGSTAMFNRAVNGVTSISRQDGTPFNLFSIDLAELNGDVSSPDVLEVTFEGLFAGGGIVTQTFQLDGDAFGAETFLFTGFNNLASVIWVQETPYHQFDNIVLSAVPVPSAVWLFLSGLLGLAGVGRRNK